MRFAIVSLALTSACSSLPEVGSTGARLSVDYFGDTDVVGFHFQVERVACDEYDSFEPEIVEANVDLVDGIFPAMISLVEQTLDPSSRHLASDFFVTLEPGCYDVTATPAQAMDGDDWTPSEDCASASDTAIEIEAGLTTEVTLLSQCVGDPLGALDVLVLLNHPPVLDLEIDEKFNYECEPVEVCATIYDPDDDPIEVAIENLTGIPEFSLEGGEPEVVGFEDGHRIWEVCSTIVTSYVTSYDFVVKAYDLASDGSRIEDHVAPETSSVSLQFPIHTNWIEEPMCWDGEQAVHVGDPIERAEGCAYTDAETYYCSGAYDIDDAVVDAVCDGSDLLEDVLYPDCD